MTYEWEARLNNVTSTGMTRAIEMIKLALKELPRIQNEFQSNNPERHASARKEALAIFNKLNEEITKVRFESNLPNTEFFIALRNPSNYTAEEQVALNSLPALLKLYGIDIFAPQPKLTNPRNRKKNIRFKA